MDFNDCNCLYCINSRIVISENGYHPICCLSSSKSSECIVSRGKYFVSLSPHLRKQGEKKEDLNG